MSSAVVVVVVGGLVQGNNSEHNTFMSCVYMYNYLCTHIHKYTRHSCNV